MKHFINIKDISAKDLRSIIESSKKRKKNNKKENFFINKLMINNLVESKKTPIYKVIIKRI